MKFGGSKMKFVVGFILAVFTVSSATSQKEKWSLWKSGNSLDSVCGGGIIWLPGFLERTRSKYLGEDGTLSISLLLLKSTQDPLQHNVLMRQQWNSDSNADDYKVYHRVQDVPNVKQLRNAIQSAIGNENYKMCLLEDKRIDDIIVHVISHFKNHIRICQRKPVKQDFLSGEEEVMKSLPQAYQKESFEFLCVTNQPIAILCDIQRYSSNQVNPVFTLVITHDRKIKLLRAMKLTSNKYRLSSDTKYEIKNYRVLERMLNRERLPVGLPPLPNRDYTGYLERILGKIKNHATKCESNCSCVLHKFTKDPELPDKIAYENWTQKVTHCEDKCLNKFSKNLWWFTKKGAYLKHHCRKCGHTVCRNCSSQTKPFSLKSTFEFKKGGYAKVTKTNQSIPVRLKEGTILKVLKTSDNVDIVVVQDSTKGKHKINKSYLTPLPKKEEDLLMGVRVCDTCVNDGELGGYWLESNLKKVKADRKLDADKISAFKLEYKNKKQKKSM